MKPTKQEILNKAEEYESDKVEEVFDFFCPVGYTEEKTIKKYGLSSDELLDYIIEVLK